MSLKVCRPCLRKGNRPMPSGKRCLIGLFSLLFAVASGFPQQKSAPKTKQTPLTDEEKEILKNRELLENLDLLQNFEKIRLLGYFTDKPKPKPDKSPAKEEKRTDEGKQP